MVSTNIQTVGSVLCRNPIYDTYVSDAKRVVSYSLGMAFAKFHSESLLNIRNLVHLEFLKQQNAIVFVPQPGNIKPQEPDLVGQDVGGAWHVFEAKGTSVKNKVTQQIADGKIQVRQISTIHGQLPATRTVSGTHIGKGGIYSRIEDPSDRGQALVDFDDNTFNQAYYAPFLISEQPGYPDPTSVIIDGQSVLMFSLENALGVLSIGILTSVYNALRTGSSATLLVTLEAIDDFTKRETDQYSFGRDGFVIGYKAKF